jgi:hypothetical protein
MSMGESLCPGMLTARERHGRDSGCGTASPFRDLPQLSLLPAPARQLSQIESAQCRQPLYVASDSSQDSAQRSLGLRGHMSRTDWVVEFQNDECSTARIETVSHELLRQSASHHSTLRKSQPCLKIRLCPPVGTAR